jgi:hypothetical protein
MTSASDFFRKTNQLFEAKDNDGEYDSTETKIEQAKADKEAKVDAQIKKSKKPFSNLKANVKESAADFFRKYSDIIAEAEEVDEKKRDEEKADNPMANKKKRTEEVKESYDDEDEDPDVAIADKEKGKDKKTQADADKGKKWNFEKADKKAEDKGAKKLKADKEALDESYNYYKKMMGEIK